MSLTTPTYREVQRVPWYWWLVGAGFALSILLAALRFYGPTTALAAGVATMVLLGLGFWAYGSTRLQVDGDGLHVGRGVVEWRWIATAEALDVEGTRKRLGPDADARAWLCVRSYLPRAVEVGLADPADPHPYWLVGSRHPERLAAAIGHHLAADTATTRAGRVSPPPDGP